MNKIINWTFGSIFRTIGRVIGYFIIACFFGLILSSNDFKITDLLGIDIIHASETPTFQYLNSCTNCSNDSGFYTRSFSFSTENINYTGEMMLTSPHTFSSSLNALNTVFSVRTNIGDFSYGSSSTATTYDSNLKIVVAGRWGSSSSTSFTHTFWCTAQNDFDNKGYINLSCPYQSNLNKFYGFYIKYMGNYVSASDSDGTFFLAYNANSYLTGDSLSSSSQAIINNQNQNQAQNHQDAQNTQDAINNTKDAINDTKDALLDDEVSDDEISSSLEFDNITDNSLGPFATFLTLPLTWVQNILASNQVCNEIDLPLPFLDVDMTLPCMNSFWNSLGVLGTLIQAVWLAVVGVRIFNGLFLLTVDTISSKDNDDELMKIKSWEL